MSEQIEYWSNRADESGEYYVNCWGSHPREDNDDCWTGLTFDTLADALEAFKNPGEHFTRSAATGGTEFVQLVGPDVHAAREFKIAPIHDDVDDGDWKRERATQAGMGLGVAGYNAAMGY